MKLRQLLSTLVIIAGLIVTVGLVQQRQLFQKKAAPAEAETSLSFIHQDHLGSIAMVTDSSGRMISQEAYYPYGTVRSTSGDSPTERGYTGQVSDSQETGLLYYNARYYDPVIAKFTQADSANDGINRYAYVGNNPINKVDPTGTWACWPPWSSNCLKKAISSDWQALQWLGSAFSRDPKGFTGQLIVQVLPGLAVYGAAYYIGGEQLAEIADVTMCALYGGGSDCVQAASMAGPNLRAADNAMPDNLAKWYDNMGLTVNIADEPMKLPNGQFVGATTSDIGGRVITFYPDASGTYNFSGHLALHEAGHAMSVGGQVPAGNNMLQFYANECVNCRWTVEQLIERGYDPRGSGVMAELDYLGYNVGQYRQAVWDTGGLRNANGSFVTRQQLLNMTDSILTTNNSALFQYLNIHEQNFRSTLIQVTGAKYGWR